MQHPWQIEPGSLQTFFVLVGRDDDEVRIAKRVGRSRKGGKRIAGNQLQPTDQRLQLAVRSLECHAGRVVRAGLEHINARESDRLLRVDAMRRRNQTPAAQPQPHADFHDRRHTVTPYGAVQTTRLGRIGEVPQMYEV